MFGKKIEIDFLLNVFQMASGSEADAENDIKETIAAIRGREGRGERIITKIILETCYLNDAQKKKVCGWAARYGLDFVKTSTGFGTGGATVEDIMLMKKACMGKVAVKASGGIRDFEDAIRMIDAGATRIGTSAGVQIVSGASESELRKRNLNLKKFAKMIDHTNVQPNATEEEVRKICSEALEQDFAAVAVRPNRFGLAFRFLDWKNVKAGAAVGFSGLAEKDFGGLSLERYNIPTKEKIKEIEGIINLVK